MHLFYLKSVIDLIVLKYYALNQLSVQINQKCQSLYFSIVYSHRQMEFYQIYIQLSIMMYQSKLYFYTPIISEQKKHNMNNCYNFFAHAFRKYGFHQLNSQLVVKKFTQIALKAGLVYAPYTFMNKSKLHCISTYTVKNAEMMQKGVLTINLSQDQQQWIETFKYLTTHIARFLQLLYIFLPTILMLPLRCFKSTEQLWISAFVSAVQKAGVVWIKVFQYMSHRRDIIGPELAESFTHLRQQAPTHSFTETQKMFRQAYGKEIDEIFEEFDTIPIASGSVSQVYKAKYHGRKVAVKVRHPGVDTYIERDVELLFLISKIGSLFSKSLKIPIGQQSMKRTLVDQIDFNIQKDNLKTFNQMFYRNKHVRFPMAFESTTKDSILVETFVEGVPITHFQNNPHPLNEVIARIGAKTFFEMLMKNNFIHADCHGGNILIELTEPNYSFFGEIKQYAKQNFYKVQQFLTEKAIRQQNLKKIYKESKEEESKMRDVLRRCKQNLKLTLIDAGMVIQLQQTDKQNFVNFVKCVIQSEGDKCAEMIYNLSNYNGKKIKKDQFPEYHEELREVFSKINNDNLDNLEGMKLLTGMLDKIRDHNMKLDGQFATLLTNIVVLQGMARDLDPNINILKCAIPYFENNNHPIADKAQRSFLTAV